MGNIRKFKTDSEKHSFEVFRTRFDRNESLYLAEKATAFEEKIYKIEYAPFVYSKAAPVVSDGAGLQATGYYSQDKVGKATFIASGADDINLLNAKQQKHVNPVRHFASAYAWDYFQLMEVLRMRMPLESDLAEQGRDAMELFLEDTFFPGDARSGVNGMLSATHAVNYSEIAAPGTSLEDADADAVHDFMQKLIDQVRINSKGRRNCNAVLLPSVLLSVLKRKKFTGTVDSVLKVLKEDNPGVEFIDSDRMTLSGSTSTTLASGVKTSKHLVMAYEKNPAFLKYKVPVLFYQHPLQNIRLNYERILTGDISGVEIKDYSGFAISAVTIET